MKRKLFCRSIGLLMLTVLMLSLSTQALAAGTQTGSISVTMQEKDGTIIPGGELILYKVAAAIEEDANRSFVPEKGFEAFEKDILGLDPQKGLRELDPQKFADYIKTNHLKGTATKINARGEAKFSGLAEGIYLIVQEKPAEGYYPINPFFVTVPYRTPEGKLLYHVDASPKSEPGEPAPTTKPTEPPATEPGKPTDPKLPQTGVLWWPVPLLAMAGLILLSLGYVLREKCRYGK